jgi:hypothetical protein
LNDSNVSPATKSITSALTALTKSAVGSCVWSSIVSMSASSKNTISCTTSKASSAVRTSSTSTYVWSGMTRSFVNRSACGTFFRGVAGSDPCHENSCSHSFAAA